MSRLSYVLLVTMALASTGALAQSPVPRPPLGPGDSSRQFPRGLQQQKAPALASDSIRVSNLGNNTLKFSAWDGAASWRPFELAPGQTVSVTCARCGSTIPIAFNDGSQNRTVDAEPADSYGLYWDAANNRWDFASVSEIMRSKLRR